MACPKSYQLLPAGPAPAADGHVRHRAGRGPFPHRQLQCLHQSHQYNADVAIDTDATPARDRRLGLRTRREVVTCAHLRY